MIPVLPGWKATRLADGLRLVPGGDEASGSITYRERLRPLRGIRELVLQHAGGPIARMETLATVEGEYAVVAAAGDAELGFVLGDDFYALVHGVCRRAVERGRFAAAVRTLVENDSLGLGRRRRRFLYAPPPGWQAVARGHETHWLAPGFPGDPTVIVVLPANPTTLDPGQFVAERLRLEIAGGLVDVEVGTAEPVSRAALPGVSVTIRGRLDGAGVVREIVVLGDGVYAYPLIFESGAALADRAVGHWAFRTLIASVKQLPGTRSDALAEVAGAWVD